MKLFMVLLGCKPAERNTEQHDIFFGVAETLKDLVPAIGEAWPEAKEKIHIDAWREVNYVDGYQVKVLNKKEINDTSLNKKTRLFFINLGGYKKNEFEEFHYKMLVACGHKSFAIQASMDTAFYKHTGFEGASSHIDDKYGVDVDDIFEIEDILPKSIKETYTIVLLPATNTQNDALNLGYFKLSKL